MRDKAIKTLWGRLFRYQATHRSGVRSIRIDNLRGVKKLTIPLDYPVTVLAGENGTGKSTALLAAACYAADPNELTEHSPEHVLARFDTGGGELGDDPEESRFHIDTESDGPGMRMTWSRGPNGWQRSVRGHDSGSLPPRRCYLRTRSSLDNPVTVRHMFGELQDRSTVKQVMLTPEQIDFALTIVPHFAYEDVVHLTAKACDMLFAICEDATRYSEPLMAGGERVALRLGLEIASLRDALVLIDEVEDGLHPQAQELLMISLQQLALKQNLQFVVTTHSPVVLDTVPGEGRVFLERSSSGKISARPAYPDVVEDVMYKRPLRAFNLLCEDEVSEAILNGVLDYLVPRQEWPRSGIQVRRDTGAPEFPTHARAFEKMGVLESFAFILDGDQQGGPVERKLRRTTKQPIIFLPGETPEMWVWDKLQDAPERYASLFGMTQRDFEAASKTAHATYINSNGSAPKRFRYILAMLTQSLTRSVPEVCRIVAREESHHVMTGIRPVASQLREAFRTWRDMQIEWME